MLIVNSCPTSKVNCGNASYVHQRTAGLCTCLSLDMTPHEVVFTVPNASGENLACILTAAQEPQPGTPVTVLCHGYTSSKNSPLLRQVTTGLLDALPTSHSVLRFDFSGNGDSDGTFKYSNYAYEAEDLRAVVEHARKGCSLNVVCVLGHSKGASVVLLYAAKYRDIPCVVNLAGRWDMRRGLKERFGAEAMQAMEEGKTHTVRTMRRDGDGIRKEFAYEMTMEQVRERMDTDVGTAARSVAEDIFVLTVHGGKDDVIPAEDGVAINQAVQNGEVVILPEAGHSFEGFEQSVVDAVAEVVRRAIGAPAA